MRQASRLAIRAAAVTTLFAAAACSVTTQPAPSPAPTAPGATATATASPTASTPAPPPSTKPTATTDPPAPPPGACNPAAKPGELYELSATTLVLNKTVSMCDYRGKVALFVNVASFCGNTPQYEGLQNLYRTYGARGFVVLGFPSNEFGEQEPGTAEEIKDFCEKTYQVEFPMFEKTMVNGPTAHPIYKWLKAQPNAGGEIEWNFVKFLVGKDGKVVERFADSIQPESTEVVTAITTALARP
jgi:glutathione peroxidase